MCVGLNCGLGAKAMAPFNQLPILVVGDAPPLAAYGPDSSAIVHSRAPASRHCATASYHVALSAQPSGPGSLHTPPPPKLDVFRHVRDKFLAGDLNGAEDMVGIGFRNFMEWHNFYPKTKNLLEQKVPVRNFNPVNRATRVSALLWPEHTTGTFMTGEPPATTSTRPFAQPPAADFAGGQSICSAT